MISVPGRVNLIGEHVDYAGGHVLPVAIDRCMTLTVESVGGTRISLVSGEEDGAVELQDGSLAPGVPPWGRYVEAVAIELAALGCPAVGIEGRLGSDLPRGAGLSSSAALEVAVATAICEAAEFELEPLELAELCQRAEHRAVGVPCGLMDQAAVILGRRGHALLLDCGARAWEHIPFPGDFAILVIHSGIVRSLRTSPYGQRRQELERGDPRRVRHVRSEIERVDAVVSELRSPHPGREAIGTLFAESHRSLAEDYDVSLPELDLLVELSLAHGAFAARLTGAGFGGSMVALTERGDAETIGDEVVRAYERRTGRRATALPCATADGTSPRSPSPMYRTRVR